MSIRILTLSVLATAATLANRFMSIAGGVPAAGAACYGVSQTDGAIGQYVPVVTVGTAYVETGAAIAAGAEIECDAQGRAITRTTGKILARVAPGQAAASAAGQKIEVIVIAN